MRFIRLTRRDEEALRRFEAATAVPMLLLALIFTVLLVIPIVVEVSAGVAMVLDGVGWIIWAVFAVEIGIRLLLAPRPLRYAASHWFDVLIVLLPFLRPLRVARSAHAFRLLGTLRVVAPLARALHDARRLFARGGVLGGLTVATLAVLGASVAMWQVERGSGGSIKNLADALWWAATTVTTVGYGDTFPVTAEGRAIAVILMIVGISIFGLLTATVAAFFVETTNEDDLADIRESLRRIETQLTDQAERESRPR